MYQGPHLSIRLRSVAGIAAEMISMAEEVPGVAFWCWPEVEAKKGATTTGKAKMASATRRHERGDCCVYFADSAVATVPYHANKLYAEALASGRYPLLVSQQESKRIRMAGKDIDALPPVIPESLLDEVSEGVPAHSSFGKVAGWGREALERRGISTEEMYPHQVCGIGMFTKLYSMLVNHDMGTGKTVTGIGAALARGAKRVLFLGLKSARSNVAGIPADMRRFFPGIPSKIVHPPKSPLRAKFGGLESFGDGVAIVTMDNLGWYLGEIAAWKPDAVIFDEISLYASRDIVRAVHDADGNTNWEAATTDRRGHENEAQARVVITELPSVKYRIGLTGTPLEEGDVARWWAVWNLLDPWGMGPGSAFDKRYVNGEIQEYADGKFRRTASNIEELKRRLAYLELKLPSEVALRRIPRSAPRVEWVEVEMQGEGRGFGFAEEERRLVKAGTPTHHIKTARAAARKEKVLFEILEQGVKGSLRQVVFTAAIRVNQVWAEKARARWPGAWVGLANAEDGDKEMDEFARLAVEDLMRPAIIFVNIGIGGRGTNALVEAHRHVLAELTSNPGKAQQALGRSWRPKKWLKGVTTEVIWLAARATVDEETLEKYLASAGVVSQFSASEQHRVLERMIAEDMRVEAREMTEAERDTLGSAFAAGWSEDGGY